MDEFISTLLAKSSLRDRHGSGPSPEDQKRARKAWDDLVAQGKKMTISAGEPLLFQVNFSVMSRTFLNLIFSEQR